MIAEYHTPSQTRVHQKSDGRKTHHTLGARQKWELFSWLKDNESKCYNLSTNDLSNEATKSLGFIVTRHTAHRARLAVYPELRRAKGSKGAGALSRIASLEARVAALEQTLQARPASTYQQGALRNLQNAFAAA